MESEKVNEAMKKGTAQAQAVYAKGNELMDRVGFLKNPLYKKIVWGVLGIIVLLTVGRIFGCGSSMSPFDVVKESMTALVSGDIETAVDYLYIPCENGKALSAEEKKLFAQMAAKQFQQSDMDNADMFVEMFKGMKEKSTDIKGDEANVTVVMRLMGEEKEQNFKLRKQDGEWKLDMK